MLLRNSGWNLERNVSSVYFLFCWSSLSTIFCFLSFFLFLFIYLFFYIVSPYVYIADIDLATITDRMAVKKAVQSGNVEDAIEKVNDLNPEVGYPNL